MTSCDLIIYSVKLQAKRSSEKCLVVMESNVTMFEETIYNVTYPLYATYMELFGLLLMTILVVISSSYIIYIILKNKELRNTNNILIINLLVTDIICSVGVSCFVVPMLTAYLADVEVHPDCDIIAPVIAWLVMSTRMMILPPAAHRFICVARPFTHNLIMTKRKIILMIVALWAITMVPYFVLRRVSVTVFIPSLGTCASVSNGVELGGLLALAGYVTSFVLTIISGVYLRHKFIHIKAHIRHLHQCGIDQRKLNKSQKLKELLREQIKPTLSLIVVGGMDAFCNLLIGTIIVVLRAFCMPIVRFQIFQTVIIPLFFLQSLGHSLSYGLYNKNIRDKMRPCYPKRSRVIVLNRQ